MIRITSLQVHWLQTISSHLAQGEVGLIYFDIVSLELMEMRRGRPYVEQLLLACRTALHELRAFYPEAFELSMVGDDFFLYTALGDLPPAEAYAALEHKAAAFRGRMLAALREREGAEELELGFGCALLRESADRDMETVLYTGMKQAIRNSRERLHRPELAAQLSEFQSIFHGRRITSVYQPIVSLEGGAVFGYEALTRGPEDSPLRSPLKLFQLAEQADMLYAFDKLTREQAIRGVDGLARDQRIFLNIPASILHDPAFSPGQTLPLLENRGLSPRNVVFEITERSSIEDFSTSKKVIDHYRSQGYRIAIDDAGAGYSSLQAIAEIQPDYIKVDRSLVTGIHRDKVKEYILETFVSFAKRLNIKVIAEGIEEAEELEKLIALGVDYAQGYFLGRPDTSLKPVAPGAAETIAVSGRGMSGLAGLTTIGQIAKPVKTFIASDSVSDATTYFRNQPDRFGAVVVDGKRPVGLLMKEEVFRKLAVQYGIALYWNKPVTVVADKRPLTVDASMPLETVSSLAMTRDTAKLYDLVVVTEQGELAGAATVRDILEQMTTIRMEDARVANPLTGLPGNERIQRELQRRILEGEPFSVLYIDLDFFKWFNDLYGFQRGDEVIQFTADAIRHTVTACGHPLDFVGHIGGDDFIVVSKAADAATLADEIVRRFHAGVSAFYMEQMRTVEDRYGRRHQVEGLSVSVSLVCVTNPSSVSADAISQAAAVCKRQAKEKLGSAVVMYRLPADLTSSGTA